jgi:hypothetical protein
MTIQSNLPAQVNKKESTLQAFDTYYSKPLELDATTFAAIQGFFESRGFSKTSAETIAVIVIKQAKQDGFNPMSVLDNLKGLSDIEVSALVSEILNYNRLNTSQLGYAAKFTPSEEVLRNIVA